MSCLRFLAGRIREKRQSYPYHSPAIGSLFRLVARCDLLDVLRVYEDQPAALFVEEPSIGPFFDQRAAECLAVAHLYYHRRWRVRHVHERVSGTHTSKPSPDLEHWTGLIDDRASAGQATGCLTARSCHRRTAVIAENARTIPANRPGQLPRDQGVSPDHSDGGPHPLCPPRPPRQIPY